MNVSLPLFPLAVRYGEAHGCEHGAKVSKKYVTKAGDSRESVAYLLRRTYPDGEKVRTSDYGLMAPTPGRSLPLFRHCWTPLPIVGS